MYIVPQFRGDEKLKYLRKSRTDDPLLTVEEVLEKHEQLLDEWVERNQPEGGPIPEENTYREVVSGETIDSRPQMRELLRRVESPKIKAVLVKEPSRLSRGDLESIGYLVKILRYTNTIVITPTEAYDLNDARDREYFERELMRGNEYLEYQKKIMATGRLLSVERGNYIPSHAPYGYNRIKVKEGRKLCPTLEPHPEQAPVVKMIFEMYRDGLGAHMICDKLDELHIPAPKGTEWAPTTLYSMLDNVHYTGRVKWNERKGVRKVEDGEIIMSHPFAEDFLVFEGKHPAIIDQELWDAVQDMRGKIPKQKADKELINPFAGILKCSKCGCSMILSFSSKKAKWPSAPRLKCPKRCACVRGSNLDIITAEVVEALRKAIEDFELRIDAGAEDSKEIHRQLVARLEKKLAELQDLELKQWDEKTKGGMPAHVFERLNTQTVAEIEEVQIALCDAKNSVPEDIDLGERLITFQAALETLQDPEAPIKEKNMLLKACIEQIDYDRDKNAPRSADPPIILDIKLRV